MRLTSWRAIHRSKRFPKLYGAASKLPRWLAAGAFALLHAPVAWSHTAQQATARAFDYGWSVEPWVLSLLAISASLYGFGLVRLWSRAGYGHGIKLLQACGFGAGWVALVGALVTPLDNLAGSLFSAYMVQHELLMLVAAPLLVLGLAGEPRLAAPCLPFGSRDQEASGATALLNDSGVVPVQRRNAR